MKSFANFLQSFADLCGILQKNADNFFPQVFYDVNWTLRYLSCDNPNQKFFSSCVLTRTNISMYVPKTFDPTRNCCQPIILKSCRIIPISALYHLNDGGNAAFFSLSSSYLFFRRLSWDIRDTRYSYERRYRVRLCVRLYCGRRKSYCLRSKGKSIKTKCSEKINKSRAVHE